jgi:hypothetical protein
VIVNTHRRAFDGAKPQPVRLENGLLRIAARAQLTCSNRAQIEQLIAPLVRKFR